MITRDASAGSARVFLMMAITVVVLLLGASTALAVSSPQSQVVSDDPVSYTPNVLDGYVSSIVEIGDKVIVGGTFTQVREVGSGTTFNRNKIFAFNKNTGAIDLSFVPIVDNTVDVVKAAADGTSVFVGGKFANVNGTANFGLAKLRVSDGQKVSGFNGTTAGRVRDLAVNGNDLYIGGDIWSVNGVPRSRLAALNATTGAVDPNFTVGTTAPRVSVDWVAKLDVNPANTELTIVGNFIEVAGLSRVQIAKIDLSGPQAVVANWSTQRFASACSGGFWTYMRDIEYSPSGDYLVVPTTGGPYLNTLCDTASRWESGITGSALLETWSDWSGGDTLTAVAITDAAIYIGGHQRWMNNHTGRDTAGIGAVSREGIAALDPINGVPYKWNPGKDRGVAVYDIHATPDALYIGSDTDFTAGEYHAKLAKFPVLGGTPVPLPTPESLPSGLYAARSDGTLSVRSYDGTTMGTSSEVSNPISWTGVGGAFHEAGKVYFVESSALRSRTYDGTTWGASVNEPSWTSWSSITGLDWTKGRMYYTTAGDNELRYRYLSLESGLVGSQTFTVSGGMNWSSVVGLAFVDNYMYYASSDSILRRVTMVNGIPSSGTIISVSGPAIDGQSWSNVKSLWFLNLDGSPSVSVTSPVGGSLVSGSVVVSADASDDDVVAQVEFFVGGVSVGVDTDGGNGWSVVWDSAGGADGSVVVSATATDSGGNSASDSVSVSVDNVGPSVSLTAPTDGATVSGFVSVTADASDVVGVAQVEFFADGGSVGVDTNGADGWSVSWDTAGFDGAVSLSATATDLSGHTDTDTISVTVDASGAGVVVLVVGNPASLSSGDVAVVARFESLGSVVTLVDDNAATAGSATGADLVVVSSTANSNVLKTVFKSVATPVWVSKPFLLDDMGMTGVTSGTDYGTVNASQWTITDPAHALAGGLSGTVSVTTSSRLSQFGVPGGDGSTVATVSGSPTIFVYEAGEQLADGTTAAGCRLAFSIFQTAPASFTTNGWALFDAAATYATNGCVPVIPNDPPVVSVTSPVAGPSQTGVVSVTADATDSDGVAQVEFTIDGVAIGVDTNGTDGWSATWDTTVTGDGPAVVVAAKATDTLGATGTGTVTVTVDNDGPTATITAPTNGATTIGTVTVTATATDAVGVTQVEFFINGGSIGVDTNGTNGWTTPWDTTTSGDGPATISVTATDTGGQTDTDTISVTVDNTANGLVVMVVGNPASLTTGATAIKTRLEGAGYLVTVLDDDGITAADTTGSNLVIIGASSNSNKVKTALNGLTQTVWDAKPWHFDDLGLTGTTANTDYGTTSVTNIAITNPTHPLAAGLTGTIGFTTSGNSVSWGQPATEADIIATANGQPTIFVYQPGKTLANGTTAPGCRITYPLFGSGPTKFTTNAWTLFDTTTTYATNNCQVAAPADGPPTAAMVVPQEGDTLTGLVSVTATATDDFGVASVEFFRDGASIGVDADGTDGFSVSWDTSGIPDGSAVVSATATDTIGQTGSDAVNVTIANGVAQQFAVLVTIDGLLTDRVAGLGAAELPSLYRLINEGAATGNARTVVEATQTLPNHTSMFTGVPVSGASGHGVTFNEDDGLTVHDSAGRYVPSMFDVAHDNGLSTLFYAGKPKFDFLDRSWDAANGAADTTGVDNGTDKIDHYMRGAGDTVTSAFLAQMAADPAEVSVVHYAGTDAAGHDFGWGSPEYDQALKDIDALVGQILSFIESDPTMAGNTVLIVTTDHGGTGTSHADPTLAVNYTIPMYVWGSGIAAGGDLYSVTGASRLDPATGQPDYTAGVQPIRNADAGNLMLELVGLGPIPGSTINVAQDFDVTSGPSTQTRGARR